MKQTNYIYCFVLSTLFSCGSNCKVDANFKNEFFNAINVVKEIQSKGGNYKYEYRVHSVEVLSAITGHKSLIYKDGDTPYFYFNTDDLNSDIKAWKLWYEENHCGFSIEDANVLIRKYDEEELDFDLAWPPKLDKIKENIN